MMYENIDYIIEFKYFRRLSTDNICNIQITLCEAYVDGAKNNLHYRNKANGPIIAVTKSSF